VPVLARRRAFRTSRFISTASARCAAQHRDGPRAGRRQADFVNFTEGQDVKKDDVLGEIDPAIYQAQYDQAVATKAKDEALLANHGST